MRSVLNKEKINKRLSGAGRPLVKSESLEQEIIDWIEEQRSRNLRVSRQMLQKQAKNVFNALNSTEKSKGLFAASNGWLMGFLK